MTKEQQFVENFRENTGRLPSQVELSKSLKISPQAAVKMLLSASQAPDGNSATLVEKIVSKGPLEALRWGLYTVSAFTFVLSVYFTSLWFKSMFNIVVAMLISLSMVTYMVLSPQVGRYTKGLVKIPVFFSFIIALVFSMGSTIAGQYSKLAENVDYTIESDRGLYDLLLQEETDLQEMIAEFQGEKEIHTETMRNLSSTAEDRMSNYNYISTERRKIEEYNARIDEAKGALSLVREELKAEIESGNVGMVERKADFFTWISGILGSDMKMVQFWIYTLPAVFIDIIAALCLNLALFMKKSS